MRAYPFEIIFPNAFTDEMASEWFVAFSRNRNIEFGYQGASDEAVVDLVGTGPSDGCIKVMSSGTWSETWNYKIRNEVHGISIYLYWWKSMGGDSTALFKVIAKGLQATPMKDGMTAMITPDAFPCLFPVQEGEEKPSLLIIGINREVIEQASDSVIKSIYFPKTGQSIFYGSC